MGQKVNPNSFRFGITKKRNANWMASSKKEFTEFLLEDSKIRDFFEKLVREYLIGKVEISRTKGIINVHVHSAKVGALLGQGGENLKKLTIQLRKTVKINKKTKVNIQVVEIKNASLNARLVAESIATQLERRSSYRSAQKQAIRSSLMAGAQGIKTMVSGRLNGVDIARTEGYTKGILMLHTLRQNIDYAQALASTTYGIIGVKVWLSLGSILDVKKGERNVTTKKN